MRRAQQMVDSGQDEVSMTSLHHKKTEEKDSRKRLYSELVDRADRARKIDNVLSKVELQRNLQVRFSPFFLRYAP